MNYRRMVILFVGLSMYTIESTQLKKVFHHKGIEQAQSNTSIELGNLVLYLDQFPKISRTVVHKGNITEQRFFLPEIEAQSSDVLAAIERINKTKDMPYTVQIAQQKIPQKGLSIILSYNNRLVDIIHNRFDSISLQKGIVFRIYNKELVKKINNTPKSIIQTALYKPHVIIDCGHGGNDLGAIGCNAIEEKKVNLAVGLQVADLLEKKNVTVYLTRSSDCTVLLDERTTMANIKNGDLFISIHANAAVNKNRSGIETYCLNNSLFHEDVKYTDGLLLYKQLGHKYEKSRKLANAVHTSLLSVLSDYCVNDRRVRNEVSQVKLGTVMPAILVEIGYLTHEQEGTLLGQKKYQSTIAQGIVDGITTYLNNV